ncbi:helix-turn-helix domain-containing protein [Aestuariicella hydrocarbonica]|uniref:Helix-turn-helix domain-containing protein n=1 Tax=Pseudomaricurvus hydrocarbonicus TaxID=1470433 RepID=A0A9E5JTY7_9GAMM|nr:helix-turn-helix domain-containing protein [Aestuariicella hydrocarbonica]NHO65254.1 helix-turn-helix domain-containing protein [Aestuariicella hydrocarbonica]
MVEQKELLVSASKAALEGNSPLSNDLVANNLQTMDGRLRCLLALLTDYYEGFLPHSEAYLNAGRLMFQADEALLLRLRFLQDDAVVEAHSGTKLSELDAIGKDSPWCSLAVEQKRTIFTDNSCVNSDAVSYTDLVVRGYLSSPVFVAGQLYGVLCFLKGESNQTGFTDEDIETIELMAKGVAKMIELQRVQPIDPEKLRAGFGADGVRTFEEYVQQARLPEVYGVPGRVVEVLQKRIGKCSLSIDFIAEEMNLSKRTLQRRLQQQRISFAQLRDQVRFHHSITYLVEQNMSIDSISASLDFSDRTSFTNAFKRWTGLSPSTFRKLFRDYA